MIKHILIKLSDLSMTTKGILIGFGLYLFIFPATSLLFMKRFHSANIESLSAGAEVARVTAREFLDDKNVVAACDVLKIALDRGLLRFYTIQAPAGDICTGPDNLRSTVNVKYSSFNRYIQSGSIQLYSSKSEGSQYVVTTGSFGDTWETFWIFAKSKIPTMLLYMFLVMTVVGILLYLVSLPLRRLAARHARQNFSQSKSLELIGLSKETRQADAASTAFLRKQQKLEEQVAFISEDFAHHILSKMGESRAFPFVFPGVFLRIDINGYTKMYYRSNKEKISELISLIARDVDDLTNRYGGSHYGFGGDEFIMLFDGENALQRAFYCARAIFSIPETLRTLEAQNLKFKAAISADSHILFNRLPQCFSLTSDALILTNRFFSAVEDRNSNSLLVGEAEHRVLAEFGRFDAGHQFSFKNIENQTTVYRLSEFVEDREDERIVHYLKTNGDILKAFKVLQNAPSDKNAKTAIRLLKSTPVGVCERDFIMSWIECLNQVDRNGDRVLLSSLINSGRNLIPNSLWSGEITDALTSLEGLSDSRVEADVIELLSFKVAHREFVGAMKAIRVKEDHYRTQGNLLVAEALSGLSDMLFEKILSMLRSPNDNEVATAVFVASRIIQIFKEKDPIALSQFLQVDRIIEEIDSLRASKSEIIKKRAAYEFERLRGENVT